MDDESEEAPPPKREQLSKVPSWIMLGFALGVGCMLVWPRAVTPPTPPPRIERTPAPVAAQPLTVEHAIFFEDVFAQLNRSAVWQDDVTEVAFWNSAQKAFSDCFEVLRVGDKFYFRSIPQLTRPVITQGMPPDSPLRFTMPAGMSIELAPTYSLTTRDSSPALPPPKTAPAVPAVTPPVLEPAKPAVELPKKNEP